MIKDENKVNVRYPDYFVIFNYGLPKKHFISKNITLHPYHVENSIGHTLLYDVTIAEVNFTENEVPDTFDPQLDKPWKKLLNSGAESAYYSKDQLEIFLACLQISNQPLDEKINLFNFLKSSSDALFDPIDDPFPIGILSNSYPIRFGNLKLTSENFPSAHNLIIDTVVNSSYYQFGAAFWVAPITPTHISNSIEFYKKVLSIIDRKNTKDEKRTSALLQNILLTYYGTKIEDTLVSISSSMAIIEAMFGSPESPTMSIQDRVPKYLGNGYGKLSKILRIMYDLRSVNAHLKYTHQFSSHPNLHNFYDNKRLISSLTTILIEKWVNEIFNGKTRKEFRTSIIGDEEYSKK